MLELVDAFGGSGGTGAGDRHDRKVAEAIGSVGSQ
jgi:hypothetical protein